MNDTFDSNSERNERNDMYDALFESVMQSMRKKGGNVTLDACDVVEKMHSSSVVEKAVFSWAFMQWCEERSSTETTPLFAKRVYTRKGRQDIVLLAKLSGWREIISRQ